MADEQITTQVEPGSGGEPPSQAVIPPEQSGGEPQSSTPGSKVEPGIQPSAQPRQRPVSDYFHERQGRKRMEQELANLKNELQALKSAGVQPLPQSSNDLTDEQFWSSPSKAITDAINKFKKELIEKDFPTTFETHYQKLRHTEKLQEEQREIEELLNPNSELSKNDPEILQKLNDIIQETPEIRDYSNSNLSGAFQLALKIYKATNLARPQTPLAPKPGQAQSTASGVGKGTSTPSLKDLKKKKDDLMQAQREDSSLRFNPEHRKKVQSVLDEIDKLIKSSEGEVKG